MATFQISGQVGPATAQDGAAPNIRQGRDGEIITADAIARFAEGTRRKKTFSGMTSAAGTTIVAANNTPIAAAAASIISLYNPIGSGVDAHLLRSWLEAISGTPAAGAFVYNVAFNQTITATQNNQGTAGLMPSCNYISGVTGACKVFVQTATTGSTLQALFKPIGASLFAAAIAATTAVNFEDKVDGDIVLPPGGLISIASPGTGTTVIVAAGFEWMEIGAQT
jgi:hypothetical protein